MFSHVLQIYALFKSFSFQRSARKREPKEVQERGGLWQCFVRKYTGPKAGSTLLKRGNFHTLLQPLYISQKNKRNSQVTAEEQLSEVISKTFFHGKTVVKHFQARDDSFPLSTLLEPKLLKSFPVCTPTAEKRTLKKSAHSPLV